MCLSITITCFYIFCARNQFVFRNHSVFSYFSILLVVWWCFSILTACQPFILHCLMHVKLNVINLFNRLSLLANQTASTTMLATHPVAVRVDHGQDARCNGDTDCDKADVVGHNNNLTNRKFIMSSSLQLHEDDLSRIDVKSLVSLTLFCFYCGHLGMVCSVYSLLLSPNSRLIPSDTLSDTLSHLVHHLFFHFTIFFLSQA